MILILTSEGDLHADAVQAELLRRGAAVVRFDPECFPERALLSLRVGAGTGYGGVLRTPDADIPLDKLSAVWLRRPGTPRAHPAYAGRHAGDVVEAEAAAVLADLWSLLDVPHLPATADVVASAARKGRQLLLAARLGFDVPSTRITNDPEDVLQMQAEHAAHGGVITKRANPRQALTTADGEQVIRYTEPVRPRDLVHVEDVRHCPLMVQAYVPKQLELRVTVVGQRVLAAAIHSQASNHTRLDWRRYDDVLTPIAAWQLPDDVASRCLALTHGLGLRYGALDLVLTPDGRYVFLEINPNGQYLWIEQATGLPISTAIAELLIDEARSSATGAAVPVPRQHFGGRS